MRQIDRERRGVWFAPYAGKTELMVDGMHTGEWVVSYGAPTKIFPTVSPHRGNVYSDGFGIGVDCDRTLVLDDISCAIDETSVLWVDVIPELNEDGSLKVDANGDPTVLPDYSAVMVSRSYNYVSVAMRQVEY